MSIKTVDNIVYEQSNLGAIVTLNSKRLLLLCGLCHNINHRWYVGVDVWTHNNIICTEESFISHFAPYFDSCHIWHMTLLTAVIIDRWRLARHVQSVRAMGAGGWRLQKTAQSAGSARVRRPAPEGCCYANDSFVGLICLLEPTLDLLSRPPDDWDLREEN